MNLSRKQIIIVGLVGIIIVVGALLFFVGTRHSSGGVGAALNVWGTDPATVFESITIPGFTIKYTQIDPSDYESQLLTALAAGNGPDVFEIGNHQLPSLESILAPLPVQLASQFSLATMANDFPSVVQTDFTSSGGIYALPLDLDTLAMFYNEDLFNSAGIVYPPATWNDFENDIPKLRILNAQGQIVQAAAAIGGSETSIAHAPDLVFLLMLQNGTQMTDSADSYATFADPNNDAGISAFNFYLQFADASSPYYTWNDNMGDATQSFAQGQTAMIFGYSSDLAAIKLKAPFLNIGIAPMPQPASTTVIINYPSYTGLAVAKSGQVLAGWEYVLTLATNPTYAAAYANARGLPPGNRALIASALTNPSVSPFIAQALTARSWYEANDEKIDAIMNSTIQSVLAGSVDPTQGLGQAQSAVSALMAGQGQ